MLLSVAVTGLQGRAWRAWVEYIQGQHADKARARSAAAFWQNHQAAIALRQWQQQVVIAREMKARAAVIVGKLRNSTQVCLCLRCVSQDLSVMSLHEPFASLPGKLLYSVVAPCLHLSTCYYV